LAQKELDAILQAENEAALTIEAAKAQARALAVKADEEAGRLMAAAMEKAEREAEAAVKEARQKTQAAEKDAKEDAVREIESIRRTASLKMKDAVNLVIDRIKKAV
jgi:vacuolar-type H+-ATPase subunit H